MSTAMQRKSEERDVAAAVVLCLGSATEQPWPMLNGEAWEVLHEVPHPDNPRRTLDILAVRITDKGWRQTIAIEVKRTATMAAYEQASQWWPWATCVMVAIPAPAPLGLAWLSKGSGIGAFVVHPLGFGEQRKPVRLQNGRVVMEHQPNWTTAPQENVDRFAAIAKEFGSRGWIAPAGTSSPRRMKTGDQLAELAKAYMIEHGLKQAALSTLLPDATQQELREAAMVMGSRRGRALAVTCRKFGKGWMVYAKGA